MLRVLTTINNKGKEGSMARSKASILLTWITARGQGFIASNFVFRCLSDSGRSGEMLGLEIVPGSFIYFFNHSNIFGNHRIHDNKHFMLKPNKSS